MKATICTIGDEILIGQIVDTNSSMIAGALEKAGINVEKMISIADDRSQIIETLEKALASSEIVISTGGLGPTRDDITKDALAKLSDSTGYVINKEQETIIHYILGSRGLDVLEENLRQAMVPDKSEVILNHRGTAPILVFRFPDGRFGHPAALYAMPGVPYETEAALGEVIEDIKQHFKTSNIYHKTIMTYGMAESALSKLIAPWEEALPSDMHLAYLPNQLTGVRLRISIYDAGVDAEKRIDEQIKPLYTLLKDNLYSSSDDTLEAVVGRLLKGSGRTLSAAESCTGGEIAHLITSVSGASDYFLGSVTSYAPRIKTSVLGVDPVIIERSGIVSSAVAEAMAEGVRRLTGSTFSVATTGWADAYGDEHEPAGTVWVAVSGPQGTCSKKFQYKGDRKRNIERFAASALDFLRRYIIKSGN